MPAPDTTLNGVTANKVHAMTAMISSWQVQGATTDEITEWVAADVNKIVVEFNKNPGINTPQLSRQPIVNIWNLNFVAKVVASTAIAVRGHEYSGLQNYHKAVQTTQRFVATCLRRQIEAKGLGTNHNPIARKDLTDECTTIAQRLLTPPMRTSRRLWRTARCRCRRLGKRWGFQGQCFPVLRA